MINVNVFLNNKIIMKVRKKYMELLIWEVFVYVVFNVVLYLLIYIVFVFKVY